MGSLQRQTETRIRSILEPNEPDSGNAAEGKMTQLIAFLPAEPNPK